jgi:hypothetical protein
LEEFPLAVFQQLWPDGQITVRKGKRPMQFITTEYAEGKEGNSLFASALSSLISPTELEKVTNSHVNPNCGIQRCDHRELAMFTTPARITYKIGQKKLTISCRLKTKSFSGTITG